jgi:hypothetical protein
MAKQTYFGKVAGNGGTHPELVPPRPLFSPVVGRAMANALSDLDNDVWTPPPAPVRPVSRRRPAESPLATAEENPGRWREAHFGPVEPHASGPAPDTHLALTNPSPAADVTATARASLTGPTPAAAARPRPADDSVGPETVMFHAHRRVPPPEPRRLDAARREQRVVRPAALPAATPPVAPPAPLPRSRVVQAGSAVDAPAPVGGNARLGAATAARSAPAPAARTDKPRAAAATGGVHIGRLEVRLVAPATAPRPPAAAVPAHGPPRSAWQPLARGFRAFGLVQG